MSEVTQNLRLTVALPRANLPGVAARIGQTLRSVLLRLRTRRVVAGLSNDQLSDIGVDRSAVLGNKPVISVDWQVTTYLRSLR